MPKTGFDFIKDIVQYLQDRGIGPDVHKSQLKKVLTIKVSIDETIHKKYIKQMLYLGILKEDPNRPDFFLLNTNIFYELME